jgi:hypothetical protein
MAVNKNFCNVFMNAFLSSARSLAIRSDARANELAHYLIPTRTLLPDHAKALTRTRPWRFQSKRQIEPLNDETRNETARWVSILRRDGALGRLATTPWGAIWRNLLACVG